MNPTGTCQECGAPFLPGASSCTQCGAALPSMAPPTPPAPLPPGAPPPPPPGVMPMMSTAQVGVQRNNSSLIAGALLAVIALVGIGVVLLNRGSDSTTKDTSPVTTNATGDGTDPAKLGQGEVLLEPVNVPTVDPFTDDQRSAAETQPTVSLPDIPIPSTSSTLATGQVPLPQVSGAQPGLYGGTRNNQVCDKEKMIVFLETHADKAAAWAGVQGIAVSNIRTYITALTPVILTYDTRVTNHGFKNGAAYAHPSVLQAGTAVLVDEYGIPRAKCSCGNPLSPPIPLTVPPIYVGPQWPTFTPTTIIVVIQTVVVVEGFTIVDITTGDLIVRPVGANPDTPDLATGDIRVTLSWGDTGDLDLQVTDPQGAAVNYDFPASASGGQLDVDANSGCNDPRSEPAENIIWPETGPDGQYIVQVTLYNDCSSPGPHPFLLQVFIGGQPVTVQLAGDDGVFGPSDGSGTLSSSVPVMYFSFTRG